MESKFFRSACPQINWYHMIGKTTNETYVPCNSDILRIRSLPKVTQVAVKCGGNQRLLMSFVCDFRPSIYTHLRFSKRSLNDQEKDKLSTYVTFLYFVVYHKSTKKVLDTSALSHETKDPATSIQKSVSSLKNKTSDKDSDDADDSSRFQTSLIIMSLLAIPVLCLVVITIIVRLKRRGIYFFNLSCVHVCVKHISFLKIIYQNQGCGLYFR